MVADENSKQVDKTRESNSLVEFFRQSPLLGLEFPVDRKSDSGRDDEIRQGQSKSRSLPLRGKRRSRGGDSA